MDPCQATRKDGHPCTAPARTGRPYCWAHDPDLGAKRQAARADGGRAKATPRRLEKMTPASLKPVLATLLETLDGLKDGSIEPRQGTAMASVATAIVRIFETAELEGRLEALEAAQEAREGTHG